MRIRTVESYVIGGVSFTSEKLARQWLQDQVGSIIDKAMSDSGKIMGPGIAIALNDAMMKNAKTLATLLDAYASPSED